MRRNRWEAVTRIAVAVAVLAGAACSGGGQSDGQTAAAAGSGLAPGCGWYRRATTSATEVPDQVFSTVFAPGGSQRIESYQYRPGGDGREPQWYVAQRPDDNEQRLQLLTSDGGTGPVIDAGAEGKVLASFGVEPESGDVFVAEQHPEGSTLSRWTIEGTEVWRIPMGAAVTGAVYTLGTGDDVRVGVVVGEPDGFGLSLLFDTDGEAAGELPVKGRDVRVARAHENELVSLEDHGIAVYDPTGRERRFFVDDRLGERGAWEFPITGANLLADGSIIATSSAAKTMALFDPEGNVIGEIGADRGAGEPLDTISHSSPVEVIDELVIYNAGRPFAAPNALTSVPAADLVTLAGLDGEITRLGFGATITADAPYRHFPAGTPVSMTVEFSSWWRAIADDRTAYFTVRRIDEVIADAQGRVNELSIPADAERYLDGVAAVELPDLPDEPGQYEVSVVVQEGDEVVGAECLRYTVGSPGLALDLGEIDELGGDRRGIELAAVFGQTLYRSVHDLADCLGDVESPDASTTVVCPPELIDDVRLAAERATELGVLYELQLGDDEAAHRNAVSSGQWGRLVGEMVAELPELTMWECWNEPNGNTFDSVADYVDRALRPCFEAVKATDPDDSVIGGSLLDVAIADWRKLIDAGGLEVLDFVGIHPYTGHNRSLEEQGLVRPEVYEADAGAGRLEQLVTLFRDAGYQRDILVTETGFWNGGRGSYFTQGDKLVRKTILQESIGIEHNANFYNDGEYTVNGLSWALLTNELTPGGLAAATYAAVLAPLSFQRWLPTSVPHTYAAEYSDEAGSRRVVAAWADDLRIPVTVSSADGAALRIADQYGRGSSLPSGSPIELTGAVTYLATDGTELSFTAATAFGADLARRQGTVATATSTYACTDGRQMTAELAIDPIDDADDYGNNCDGISAWQPSADDPAPALTITLPAPAEIDRVYVAGKGLGSVETGIRSFAVEIAQADGTFVEVARVENAYFERAHFVSFDPVSTTAVRVRLLATNYSGYGGPDGSKPPSWTEQLTGLGGVYAVELYGPTGA